jgi:hypothetical protein
LSDTTTESPSTRSLPFGSLWTSPSFSLLSPSNTQRTYAKDIRISIVSMRFGSVIRLFSSSLLFQSLCIASMPNRSPYTVSAFATSVPSSVVLEAHRKQRPTSRGRSSRIRYPVSPPGYTGSYGLPLSSASPVQRSLSPVCRHP